MRYFDGMLDAYRIVTNEYTYLNAEHARYHFFSEENLMLAMDFVVDGNEITVEYERIDGDWYFYEEYRWDE